MGTSNSKMTRNRTLGTVLLTAAQLLMAGAASAQEFKVEMEATSWNACDDQKDVLYDFLGDAGVSGKVECERFSFWGTARYLVGAVQLPAQQKQEWKEIFAEAKKYQSARMPKAAAYDLKKFFGTLIRQMGLLGEVAVGDESDPYFVVVSITVSAPKQVPRSEKPLSKGKGDYGPGNGGDIDDLSAGTEFLKQAELVVADFQTWAGKRFPGVNANALAEVVSDLKAGKLELIPHAGQVHGKDARNLPGVGIKFDRKLFNGYRSQPLTLRAFIFHELAGPARIEENHVSLSAQYLRDLIEREYAIQEKPGLSKSSNSNPKGSPRGRLVAPDSFDLGPEVRAILDKASNNMSGWIESGVADLERRAAEQLDAEKEKSVFDPAEGAILRGYFSFEEEERLAQGLKDIEARLEAKLPKVTKFVPKSPEEKAKEDEERRQRDEESYRKWKAELDEIRLPPEHVSRSCSCVTTMNGKSVRDTAFRFSLKNPVVKPMTNFAERTPEEMAKLIVEAKSCKTLEGTWHVKGDLKAYRGSGARSSTWVWSDCEYQSQ